MKTKVISYSYTGNNESLAASFAKAIGAEHVHITEPKKRTTGMIIKEHLFNRDAKINLSKDEISEDVFVIFFAPFWFGKIATPARSYFKQLKDISFNYGFISLCVGSDDPEFNNKLKNALSNMIGRDPEFVIIKKLADLFPPDPKPTPKMLMTYRTTDEHLKMLVSSIKESIEQTTL